MVASLSLHWSVPTCFVKEPGGVHAASQGTDALTSQRGSGSQTEELRALLFPFTSSSNALEDELSCLRLAAGGGFGEACELLPSLYLQ